MSRRCVGHNSTSIRVPRPRGISQVTGLTSLTYILAHVRPGVQRMQSVVSSQTIKMVAKREVVVMLEQRTIYMRAHSRA
jgi:hypothetical protein